MADEEKFLTVGELKAAIAELPDDMLVYSDGCDCTGKAGGTSVKTYQRYHPETREQSDFQALLIERAPGQ